MTGMGKVYLVGAGPGAPDLITVRGAEILRSADIVFYDALVHPGTLELAIKAEKVAVGKRCGQRSTAQRFINKRLLDAARKYAIVVRLKGGDPMLFGRAQEEIDVLKAADVVYEIVPGVTAALAASAELGISLTRRGLSRSVTLATPRIGEFERNSGWIKNVLAADSAVLYMAAGQIPQIAASLQAAGMSEDTPVVVIENASLPSMRRIDTTLRGLAAAAPTGSVTGPALIMFGEVFRQHQDKAALEASLHVLQAKSAHRA